MNILGIGIVFARGRGIAAFADALAQGWTPPDNVDVPAIGAAFPVYRVRPEVLTDKAILPRMRRADRFSRLAVLAAHDALLDSGLPLSGKNRIGIILCSAFGPHATTFKFLDDILEFGETGVSPTTFSNSVHNAAASYVSSLLDIRGPTLTLTQFHFAFPQALLLAGAWLRENRCDHLLVGAVEECGEVMEYACSRKLTIARDGKIKPFAFSPSPEAVPGEGSVFLLLSNRQPDKAYGRIAAIHLPGNIPPSPSGDLHILDANGLIPDESAYRQAAAGHPPVAGYSPVFGSLLTGTAFHVAAAALMLRNQVRYASPVPWNPHNLAVCRDTVSTPMQTIYCTGFDCYNQRLSLTLTGKGQP